ncbi:xanthine dehydrogenase molybdopterin binding subunit [Aliishimia ponticola]|uniref:Xanthine dehydrogenase molybdopterin binding subunit n=1 Tax=Aliishimia ponticola TaxID=2499833 RepID=A0A4S4NA44_9RHOB|nr:xanthine dehydrogenase molybdopterin binding subunit [Aliishimia ponticola]THH36079.1 xanthine dehydrogenase molybdopterin binding subunit [Aliishimia ponticola]
MTVGTSRPHDSARLHVTGEARYVDDIPTPAGTLHLAFGLSQTAAGQLEGLDLDAVRAAPGVVAVLTHADLKRPADCSPSAHDEPLLCDGAVHYLGQPLFLVIADTHVNARRAARLGKAQIAETTPILTIDEALAQGSRFEEGPRIYQTGDAGTAIAAAPHRLEASFDIGGQEHFYLEGQAALVLPTEDGGAQVHSSTQHPTEIQHKVADALGVPMHAVRVETRRMGGGFGGKESQGNHLAIACAVAAEATGRPCKMRYDRDDDFLITGKRHDFRIDYTCGFDETGRILGLDFVQYTRCGWSMDLSLPVADRAMLHAGNAYHLENMRVESHRLRTNTQSATAFRGFGGPQGVIGMERVIDHVAHHLGLDPIEVRRRNFYAPDGENGAADQTTHYGQPVQGFLLHEMTDQLLASADYAQRREDVRQFNDISPVLKRGLAYAPVMFGISFTLTHLNQAGALVHVYMDGSVHLNHGGTEMGQGLNQKVAQVAAARFGIPLESVKITATDTGKVPNTSATAASSGSDLNGMAVQVACDEIRDRLSRLLAEKHQCTPAQVTFAGGKVTTPGAEYSFAEVAHLAWTERVSLSATGFYKTPDIKWDRIKGQGHPFFYYAYGCALSEVLLDTLTGEYRLTRVDILHDAGASLNPALDIGQIEGGYVQGAGWLTTEELVWDARGALRTHAPSTYKIPGFGDQPDIFNVALFDAGNRADTVYRSKAVGEPPLMLGISAFLALSDAAASCGARYPRLSAPATPEELCRAIARTRA